MIAKRDVPSIVDRIQHANADGDANVDAHADKLSPGQIALLKQLPGFTMDVYPTHRSCGYPKWIYDATRKNATTASLDADQVFLEKGWHPFLFPIPTSGATFRLPSPQA